MPFRGSASSCSACSLCPCAAFSLCLPFAFADFGAMVGGVGLNCSFWILWWSCMVSASMLVCWLATVYALGYGMGSLRTFQAVRCR